MKVQHAGYAAAQVLGVGGISFAYGAFFPKGISSLASGTLLGTALAGGLALEYATRKLTTAYQINFRKALFIQSGVSALYHAALLTAFVALGVLTASQAVGSFLPLSILFSIRQAILAKNLRPNFKAVNPTPLPKSLQDFPMIRESLGL